MMLSVVERARGFMRGHPFEALLLNPLFYELSDSIMSYGNDVLQDLVSVKGARVWQDARLPSQDGVVMWAPEMEDCLLALNVTPREDSVFVAVIKADGHVEGCGKFTTGSAEIQVSQHEGRLSKEWRAQSIMLGAALLSIVNAPRITRRVPCGTRQQRRAMERRGLSPASWHRIEWDLTKPQIQTGERKGAGWHMPLHYTRGHWRIAEKTHANVTLREDGKYYKWIDGYWSGHPAYGIKKAVYAPRIGEKA